MSPEEPQLWVFRGEGWRGDTVAWAASRGPHRCEMQSRLGEGDGNSLSD